MPHNLIYAGIDIVATKCTSSRHHHPVYARPLTDIFSYSVRQLSDDCVRFPATSPFFYESHPSPGLGSTLGGRSRRAHPGSSTPRRWTCLSFAVLRGRGARSVGARLVEAGTAASTLYVLLTLPSSMLALHADRRDLTSFHSSRSTSRSQKRR